MSASGVLVVEDEDTLRLAVVRGLARRLSVPVRGAATFAEALASIDEHPPAVILCDLDLPDRAGIEIIGELGRRGLRSAVTFVSAYTKAFLAQIPRHAGVRVLEKPVSVEQLRALVLDDLGKLGAVEPTPFGVADFLQLAAMGGHSVVIEVPSREGRILVVRGELWSATDAKGAGDAAFRRLCLSRDSVRCTTLRDAPGPRTIESRWEAMLLDEARAEDERRRDGLASDAPEPRVDVSISPAESSSPPAEVLNPDPNADRKIQFEQCLEDGLSALLLRKYPEAWRAFRRAEQIDPTDRTVQGNLARLRELGHGDAE